MNESDPDREGPRKKLQVLLTEAGFTHQRWENGGRTIIFSGQYHDRMTRLVASSSGPARAIARHPTRRPATCLGIAIDDSEPL